MSLPPRQLFADERRDSGGEFNNNSGVGPNVQFNRMNSQRLNRQDSGSYDGGTAPIPPVHEHHDRYVVPDEVAEYLRYFKRCLRDQNVTEIHNLYDFGFTDLTERYYRGDKMWPDEDKVRQVIGEDPDTDLFLMLYKELYYRYLYGKLQRGPSLEARWMSFQNYQALFSHILNPPEPVKLNLPNQWLWDIVDEFVYQFQSFCQFKSSVNKRSKEEIEDLVQMESQLWNLYPVMNILYSLVKKSQVNEQLAAAMKKEKFDGLNDFGSHPLYYKLGYFSLIGLLRLHVLLGDYFQALKTVENIQFNAQEIYNTVTSCAVTFHYFVGFCHMMMRHYQDTVQLFVNCLMYIQRTRGMQYQQQPQQKTWQYDIISKTSDQMYNLLAICLILQPQRIDETIQSQLTEKMSEKMNRMARGELNDFENAFQSGCPKFLSPTVVNYEANMNFSKEPTLLQTRVFMEEVKQQILIPILRGYLKLYTTMTLSKLASFVDLPEDELISGLLSFKHKMCDVSKSDSTGEEDSNTTDLDFYVDKDMIHIADTKVARRYGEYFIRHIQKLMELNANLSKIGVSKKERLHEK